MRQLTSNGGRTTVRRERRETASEAGGVRLNVRCASRNDSSSKDSENREELHSMDEVEGSNEWTEVQQKDNLNDRAKNVMVAFITRVVIG
jgi:hypothetical protein